MSPFDTTGLESVKVYILTERTWAACNIVQCSEVIAGCRPTQHDTAVLRSITAGDRTFPVSAARA